MNSILVGVNTENVHLFEDAIKCTFWYFHSAREETT